MRWWNLPNLHLGSCAHLYLLCVRPFHVPRDDKCCKKRGPWVLMTRHPCKKISIIAIEAWASKSLILFICKWLMLNARVMNLNFYLSIFCDVNDTEALRHIRKKRIKNKHSSILTSRTRRVVSLSFFCVYISHWFRLRDC